MRECEVAHVSLFPGKGGRGEGLPRVRLQWCYTGRGTHQDTVQIRAGTRGKPMGGEAPIRAVVFPDPADKSAAPPGTGPGTPDGTSTVPTFTHSLSVTGMLSTMGIDPGVRDGTGDDASWVRGLRPTRGTARGEGRTVAVPALPLCGTYSK